MAKKEEEELVYSDVSGDFMRAITVFVNGKPMTKLIDTRSEDAGSGSSRS